MATPRGTRSAAAEGRMRIGVDFDNTIADYDAPHKLPIYYSTFTAKGVWVTPNGAEKLDAVKKEGMQPQQYNNVIQMVEVDNSLKQKFLTYVQELKNS